MAGAGTLAIAGGMLLATGGSALASQTPGYEPDVSATLGGIDLFNAAGVQITSGNLTDAPIAAYAVAQNTPATTTKVAGLFAFTPNSGLITPLGTTPQTYSNHFNGEQLSSSTNYPITAPPANIAGISNPVVTGLSTDESLTGYIGDLPNTDSSTTDGFGNLYQLRIKVSGVSGYAAASIQVTGSTWTQVSGTYRLFADTTSTTLVPTPASPSVPATNVTLTATVADSTVPGTIPAGTVSFYDGTAVPANLIGTAQPVNTTTGKASVSTSTLSTAAHTLTAVFTPTNSTLFAASTGTAPYTIANLDGSNTALSVNPTTGPAFSTVDLTATVTDTTNNVSTPASPNGWFTEDTAPTYSTAGIVFDNSVNTGVIDYLQPVADLPLVGVSGLSYTVNNTGGPQTAYDMEVDTTGPGTGYTTLAWEPDNNGFPLVGDGTVHTFSTLEAGKWWSSHIANPAPGSQSDPITLSAFDTLYPNAVIISYGAHQHNAGSVSTVNHITFQSANTTFTSNNAASTVPTGTVQFFDGATSIGSPVALAAGVATLHDTAGFTFSSPGPTHSITAVYSGSSTIAGSTSQAVVFTATAPACPNGEDPTLCTDPQTVEATVAAGTITITTPYSPSNPLNLGTFQLNSAGTLLSASAPFGNTTNTASEIFVTDTRAGDTNWTASVQSGNFTSTQSPGTPIDGQNAGLVGLTVQPVAGNALTAGNVTVTNNPSGTAPIISGGTQGIGGAKHTFAVTTAGGDGSVGFTGTFTLNAPTSTGAGLYTGTVTFTVG
jgi:Bacterial Ig-like domain (group 3)